MRALALVLLLAAVASAQRPGNTLVSSASGLAASPLAESGLAVLTSSSSAAAMGDAEGSLAGLVHDTSNDSVPGATVTLETGDPARTETTQADDLGAFAFARVPAGAYTLRVDSPGFTSWTSRGTLSHGEGRTVEGIAMAMIPVSTTVHVVARAGSVAQAQLHFEEQQRVLGVFPNFYASYIWDADPLTARQKYQLAWRFSVDPTAFAMAGAVAVAQQLQGAFPGYGRGFPGYGKRFAASYVDGFNSTMLGQAVLPAMLHQDPRYFVKGSGTVGSRLLYALASTVICRGDNGRWQPNYSNVLGNVGAASLSNLYYPTSSRRGLSLTFQTAGVSTALGAVGGLMQEFVLHRMTPGIPDYRAIAASR